VVDMRTCSFCGEAIDPGTGKMFIRRDGTIFYFCSSKCQNNARLGRVPRRVRWTRTRRKAVGKE
jgi:large subunit ribosomal protein L24e